MRQLSLFDGAKSGSERRGALDPASEALLEQFRAARAREGAGRRSLLRECSQLRSLARNTAHTGRSVTLAAMVTDLASVARALREPATPISRATGRARLVAVQRFLRIMGPLLGRDPDADLADLDALLPARAASGWHDLGTLVAGDSARRRQRGPTLDAVDLHRLVETASEGTSLARSVRDRALVAVQCFSGLRVEEAVALCWEDLGTDLAGAGYFGLTASVRRGNRLMRLPLPGPIGAALDTLRDVTERSGIPATGPIFRAVERSNRPLSYRGARKVLVAACRRAGLPAAGTAELRAGCAYWLRSQGLSEHDVATVLGLARVRSVDRLLSRHTALDAQRRVREHLES